MAADTPLSGIALVDCAQANARDGVAIAARQCGFGDDTAQFLQALQQAGKDMGVEITELSDLITEQQTIQQNRGIEVAPDTSGQL